MRCWSQKELLWNMRHFLKNAYNLTKTKIHHMYCCLLGKGTNFTLTLLNWNNWTEYSRCCNNYTLKYLNCCVCVCVCVCVWACAWTCVCGRARVCVCVIFGDILEGYGLTMLCCEYHSRFFCQVPSSPFLKMSHFSSKDKTPAHWQLERKRYDILFRKKIAYI